MSRRELAEQSNLGSPGRESIHHRKRFLSSPQQVLPVTFSRSPFTATSHCKSDNRRKRFGYFGNESSRIWKRVLQICCRRKYQRLVVIPIGCLCCMLLRSLASTASNFSPFLYNESRILLHGYYHSDALNGTQTATLTKGRIRLPSRPMHESNRPNRGGISYTLLSDSTVKQQTRLIQANDPALYQKYRSKLLRRMDENEIQVESAQDLAILKDPSRYEHYDEISWHESKCQRPKWSFETNLNCNSVHEVYIPQLAAASNLQNYAIKYLSEGSFRMAWLLQETNRLSTSLNEAITDTQNTIVMKNLRLALDWNALTVKQVHLEALVMSQTLDSRATADIYGHCGTSILVETGQSIRNSVFYSQELMSLERVQRKQLEYNSTSLNDLEDEQRLKLALRMAESLAAMHGNVNGVIVNDDLQVFQWVVTQDGNIKLNDFNNAIVMEWNEKDQKYCKFNGEFDSVYRSPQENTGEPTDESADVHVLGSILYNLLTGLMPFYHEKSHREAVKALVHRKETPCIDPAFRNGTLIQQSLVDIMEDCWHYQSDKRPSVFTVLKKLRAIVVEYERTHPSADIGAVDLRPLGRPL